MTDLKPYKPPRPKPRPGSLPMKSEQPTSPPHPAQSALPPFIPADELTPKTPPKERVPRSSLEKLKGVMKKAEELRADVRNDAFDDWVRRCVVTAQEPTEWTQARILYENYLAHAKTYGNNRADRALSVQELATETQWGRMMATLFPKKRRRAGWYYQLRCKRGR